MSELEIKTAGRGGDIMTAFDTIREALIAAGEYAKIGGWLREQIMAALVALPQVERQMGESEALREMATVGIDIANTHMLRQGAKLAEAEALIAEACTFAEEVEMAHSCAHQPDDGSDDPWDGDDYWKCEATALHAKFSAHGKPAEPLPPAVCMKCGDDRNQPSKFCDHGKREPAQRGHHYPKLGFFCVYGCGCYQDENGYAGPEDINPLGECPCAPHEAAEPANCCTARKAIEDAARYAAAGVSTSAVAESLHHLAETMPPCECEGMHGIFRYTCGHYRGPGSEVGPCVICSELAYAQSNVESARDLQEISEHSLVAMAQSHEIREAKLRSDLRESQLNYQGAMEDCKEYERKLAAMRAEHETVISNLAIALFPKSPTECAHAEFLLDGMGACQAIDRLRTDLNSAITERDKALLHLHCPTIANLPKVRHSDEAWERKLAAMTADRNQWMRLKDGLEEEKARLLVVASEAIEQAHVELRAELAAALERERCAVEVMRNVGLFDWGCAGISDNYRNLYMRSLREFVSAFDAREGK